MPVPKSWQILGMVSEHEYNVPNLVPVCTRFCDSQNRVNAAFVSCKPSNGSCHLCYWVLLFCFQVNLVSYHNASQDAIILNCDSLVVLINIIFINLPALPNCKSIFKGIYPTLQKLMRSSKHTMTQLHTLKPWPP